MTMTDVICTDELREGLSTLPLEIAERRWFTADLHLGHANIIGYCGRPFDGLEDMNLQLISNWNDVVGAQDEVYILGDLTLKPAQYLDVCRRLKGRKLLIPGNHDRCWPHHHKRGMAKAMYEAAGFTILPEDMWIRLGDQHVRLNHFPYEVDERHGERLSEYNPKDNGDWLLHGHVHQLWQVRDRQINVGVDVWDYTPVAEETLIALMAA